jgi:hypothetical protein
MLRAALVLATTASAAIAGAPSAGSPSPGSSAFGGPVPIHLARVGHIEIDIGPAGSAGLRQVRCAFSAAPGTTCFVGR